MTVKTMVRVDAPNSPKLEEMLDAAINEKPSEIIVDMEDTVYICSVGLRVILGAQKKLRSGDTNMILKNVRPEIMEIFDVTGFSDILNIE